MSSPSRSRFEADTVTAISAVVIGVCALGVSLYQAAIMRQQQALMVEQSQMAREQQRASVWPNVEVGTSYPGDELRLLVLNTGIGPARVEAVRVTLDGAPVPQWSEVVAGLGGRAEPGYTHSAINGRVLPAGERLDALVLTESAVAASVQSALERVDVELCYCSVYDECWRLVQDFETELAREPAATCDGAPDGFEQ